MKQIHKWYFFVWKHISSSSILCVCRRVHGTWAIGNISKNSVNKIQIVTKGIVTAFKCYNNGSSEHHSTQVLFQTFYLRNYPVRWVLLPPVSQMWKRRHRMIQYLAQDHGAARALHHVIAGCLYSDLWRKGRACKWKLQRGGVLHKHLKRTK